ncbi:Zn(II)2Cys6 transcription factor domain-containing protein [Sporobolomyces salmoneus]|uniref:Zn(II)2Cys6 transcription factor domain-containing protein n=1 Tax=Sporobolomyces salmoneus TaxID=183962 RepID=UPI003181575C
MTPSPPQSPHSDDDSVIILDDDKEEVSADPNTRDAPTSLAARFRNLCQTSPSPPPEASVRRIPPPPPSPPTVSRFAGYRPLVSRTSVHSTVPRVRASQVRSCDQCRTSKQKCDRNLPCATCSMRRVKCTWEQAGTFPPEAAKPPPGSLSTQIAANRIEIGRLRKEANTLARLLRLTPHEFELFHAEAKRLVEGTKGEPIKLPSLISTKRSRASDDYERGGPHKLPRRLDERAIQRIKPHPPSQRSFRLSASDRPPHWVPNRPYEPRATYSGYHPIEKRKSSSTSPVLSKRAPVSTTPTVSPSASPTLAPIRERSVPQSRSSFSDLPPLKIPSRAGLDSPGSALPLRSAHRLSSTSTTTPSLSRRRPNYVLPTPVYSATPTSASFFPLSSTSSPALGSKAMSISKSWPAFSRYESTTSARVQPYTPLSAVRDEAREREADGTSEETTQDVEKEGEEQEIEKSVEAMDEDKEKEEAILVDKKKTSEEPRVTSSPKIVIPSIRNLLNDLDD